MSILRSLIDLLNKVSSVIQWDCSTPLNRDISTPILTHTASGGLFDCKLYCFIKTYSETT